MKEIASLNNAVVKAVCELKQKKYRERENCFVVEGMRAVEEAVSYAFVQKIFALADKNNARLQQLLASAEAKQIELYAVTEAVMKKMSDTEAPQGVLAVCEKPQGVVVSGGDVLVLDRVADPGNVGTLIRTAEAAGMAGVILLAGCADAYAPKTVRSTMGSLLRVPVLSDVPEADFIGWCKKNGYEIMVTCLDGAQDLYRTDFAAHTAIVVGSEAYGASEGLKQAAAKRVFIPMQGRAESLNAAMAGGIVMFEALRRRLATKQAL
ncbi:MAG: RNA methyltransferase [Phascolarctobacterium sp.]|nr:MAG: RNA methyltransferase [Phascolarctobacterium sp.]